MDVRQAVFAGSWYPASRAECEREIRGFLKKKITLQPEKRALGAIVPHAGWVYSGGIACRAISLLSQDPAPDTIVIFGMHLHPDARPRIISADGIETPLGIIEADKDFRRELIRRFSFREEDAFSFSPDNTIELQLPFIKYFFQDARIVPVGVPPSALAPQIGAAAVEIARDLGRQIAVVGSTDLTHYGPNFGLTHYGTGPAAHEKVRRHEDRRIIDEVLTLDPMAVINEALASHNACCSGAIAATITACRELGAVTAVQTEYATSYDIGPAESFVGYAGVIFQA